MELPELNLISIFLTFRITESFELCYKESCSILKDYPISISNIFPSKWDTKKYGVYTVQYCRFEFISRLWFCESMFVERAATRCTESRPWYFNFLVHNCRREHTHSPTKNQNKAAFQSFLILISISAFQSFTRTAMNLAQLMGPSVGGALYQAGGFHLPFLTMGAGQAFMGLLSWVFLPSLRKLAEPDIKLAKHEMNPSFEFDKLDKM